MNTKNHQYQASIGDRLGQAEDDVMRGRIDRRTFMRVALAAGMSAATAGGIANRAFAATTNQQQNVRSLKSKYDYIVVGAGSAGCVVASRLTENPDISVLLLEAGGWNDQESVTNPSLWPTNIGTPQSYVYETVSSAHCNGRNIPIPMGRGIGGGSAINVSVWARGHKENYDEWARITDDPLWGYDSVLSIYKNIEDWQGPASQWRGKGGNVFVESLPQPNPIAPAMVAAAKAIGIPSTDDINGQVMEGDGACGIAQALIKDNRRHGIAAAYLHPALARPNLTVLTDATAAELDIRGDTAHAVYFVRGKKKQKIEAANEIILSAGTIGSAQLLMLSGIGDPNELQKVGIKPHISSPNVGRNLRDHILLGGCVWEYKKTQPPRNNLAECTFFWKSDDKLSAPDLQPFQIEIPFVTETVAKQYTVPENSWTLAPGLVQPKSRGRMTLVSSDFRAMPKVDPNYLAEPDDLRALTRCVELCREIGNSAELSDYVRREVTPGKLDKASMEDFIRNATGTYFHVSGTCAMGKNPEAVVDSQLRVRGVRRLRVADASVMPNLTTGNTMAPSVIIGERMAHILRTT